MTLTEIFFLNQDKRLFFPSKYKKKKIILRFFSLFPYRMAGLSSMKIHYFDEGGRAEVSRLVLVWAGKSFEDIRIPFQEWPDVKPTMPLGQVPVLDMGGQKYPQSLAIAAYLAREFDLYGNSNLDSLKIDVIAQTVFEFRIKHRSIITKRMQSKKKS